MIFWGFFGAFSCWIGGKDVSLHRFQRVTGNAEERPASVWGHGSAELRKKRWMSIWLPSFYFRIESAF